MTVVPEQVWQNLAVIKWKNKYSIKQVLQKKKKNRILHKQRFLKKDISHEQRKLVKSKRIERVIRKEKNPSDNSA